MDTTTSTSDCQSLMKAALALMICAGIGFEPTIRPLICHSKTVPHLRHRLKGAQRKERAVFRRFIGPVYIISRGWIALTADEVAQISRQSIRVGATRPHRVNRLAPAALLRKYHAGNACARRSVRTIVPTQAGAQRHQGAISVGLGPQACTNRWGRHPVHR